MPKFPLFSPPRALTAASFLLLLSSLGCHRHGFPDVPDGYREFAYIANGTSNTVTVLDLVYLRLDHTLQVGTGPSAIAANPARNEIYAVNTGSNTISVIDALNNRVAFTIPVHHQPRSIAIDPTGHRAYVANTGSNTVSVLDLDRRREIGAAGTGEQPTVVRIAPDGRTLVVTNRAGGSVSLFDLTPWTESSSQSTPGTLPRLRSVWPHCPGATDAVILHDSAKVFIACTSGHQVMAISLAQPPDSWAAKHDASLTTDHMLTMLDVGENPVHLSLKPDNGEIFASNSGSDSISEISAWTNEVETTFPIGSRPVYSIVGQDNTLWAANFGADSISIYSIDDGRLEDSVHTGSGPTALAFSADEHLLLATDAHSGDVAVIRTQGTSRPVLFTLLPAGNSPNAIAVKVITRKP